MGNILKSIQVMAVHSAIVKGAKQVCDVSNKEMLDLMEITDEIRKQIGDPAMHEILLTSCQSLSSAYGHH